MMLIDKNEKRGLLKRAHHLKPVVYIGKKGFTDELLLAVDGALSSHELIKIKFIDFKDERMEISERLSEETGAALIKIIGNTAILFRKNSDLDS